MDHIDKIAKLISEDPDILDEGWDELGIEDPGLDDGQADDVNYDELIDNDPVQTTHIIKFAPKNFSSKEAAIKYAWEALGVDLSDGRQHPVDIKGPAGVAKVLAHLEWEDEYLGESHDPHFNSQEEEDEFRGKETQTMKFKNCKNCGIRVVGDECPECSKGDNKDTTQRQAR